MSYDLHKNKLKFGKKYHDEIRIAHPDDLSSIKADLYPKMKDHYDIRYFRRLGEEEIDCFLCEQSGTLIHYSWIFYDLAKSPLISLPMNRRRFGKKNIWWGPTFTIPNSRGIIYPYIFSKIVIFLRSKKLYDHILITAHKGNKGAVSYYKNLGFVELPAQPKPRLHVSC
tara:strand:+ start:7058 stop:7564 length:507 start_codon:yes stop_codon:yes gene_type:complete